MLSELSGKLGLTSGTYRAYPALVTWLVEDLEIFEGIPVVPVFKFNSFIDEMEAHDDLLVSYTGQVLE